MIVDRLRRWLGIEDLEDDVTQIMGDGLILYDQQIESVSDDLKGVEDRVEATEDEMKEVDRRVDDLESDLRECRKRINLLLTYLQSTSAITHAELDRLQLLEGDR